MHQAEDQAHGRVEQLPFRRGRLGLIVPLITVVVFVTILIISFASG